MIDDKEVEFYCSKCDEFLFNDEVKKNKCPYCNNKVKKVQGNDLCKKCKFYDEDTGLCLQPWEEDPDNDPDIPIAVNECDDFILKIN